MRWLRKKWGKVIIKSYWGWQNYWLSLENLKIINYNLLKILKNPILLINQQINNSKKLNRTHNEFIEINCF